MAISSRTRGFQDKLAALFLFLAISMAISGSLYAQQSARQTANKHCLWEVENQSSKIYLLGSLHVLKSEAYPLAQVIEKAYASSRKIVFETDLGGMIDADVQAKMLTLGLYPEGQDLLQNISQDTRLSLEKKLKKLSLPMEQFVRFRPWFLAVTLTTLELQRLGFNPLYGIDMHYYGKARTDGKKIGFLESVEFQLDLLGKMNTHDQNAFLNQTLKDLEVAAQMASDMMRYWQTGDSKNLYKLLFKSFEGYPEIQDRLLVQRNKDWAIKIAQMLKETNQVLVIVGAGHLIGPNSVVELLKQKGYSVKQR
ncbi:MAG: TraB/GumN family protein [Desulfobacterales bacterium]|jgi:hypothetical protein